jgi:hypothetical protein
MADTRERLQSRLADIEQALKEARSADVRELLSDLLDRCRQDMAVVEGPARDATKPERAAAG